MLQLVGKPRRPSQAGSSLIEILVVLLLVSVLAAALMTGMMDEQAAMDAKALDGEAGTEDLAGLLELWTSDPQDLERSKLESETERQEYQTLVENLEQSNQLGTWRDLLHERLGAGHPLLVALDPEAESMPEENTDGKTEAQPVDPADGQDPDIRWVD